jgi:hypothetical protein
MSPYFNIAIIPYDNTINQYLLTGKPLIVSVNMFVQEISSVSEVNMVSRILFCFKVAFCPRLNINYKCSLIFQFIHFGHKYILVFY